MLLPPWPDGQPRWSTPALLQSLCPISVPERQRGDPSSPHPVQGVPFPTAEPPSVPTGSDSCAQLEVRGLSPRPEGLFLCGGDSACSQCRGSRGFGGPDCCFPFLGSSDTAVRGMGPAWPPRCPAPRVNHILPRVRFCNFLLACLLRQPFWGTRASFPDPPRWRAEGGRAPTSAASATSSTSPGLVCCSGTGMP